MTMKYWGFADWKDSGMVQANLVRVIETVDYSQPYEMDTFTVMELDNGQFLTALEVGCSCYTPMDAHLSFHPDLATAVRQLEKYRKEHECRRYS